MFSTAFFTDDRSDRFIVRFKVVHTVKNLLLQWIPIVLHSVLLKAMI